MVGTWPFCGTVLRLIALLLLSFGVAMDGRQVANADVAYPELTGRIVDRARLLSAATRSQLDALFAQHEAAFGNQVVLVTVESLQGATIEDYGVGLGRHWAIGEKDKDNGVLLIVAPSERKVRIEVGYGLEGTLTDAVASDIIQRVILPAFRQDDMDGGIRAGATAIVRVLGHGSYEPYVARKKAQRWEERSLGGKLGFLGGMLLVLFGLLLFIRRVLGLFLPSRPRRMFGRRRRSRWWWLLGGGAGGGGFSGGGFSGGGGSFGGGGASGGW